MIFNSSLIPSPTKRGLERRHQHDQSNGHNRWKQCFRKMVMYSVSLRRGKTCEASRHHLWACFRKLSLGLLLNCWSSSLSYSSSCWACTVQRTVGPDLIFDLNKTQQGRPNKVSWECLYQQFIIIVVLSHGIINSLRFV